MKLLESYGSAWGAGKAHLPSDRPATSDFGHSTVPVCNSRGIYAKEIEGSIDDVTCKACLRIYVRDQARHLT